MNSLHEIDRDKLEEFFQRVGTDTINGAYMEMAQAHTGKFPTNDFMWLRMLLWELGNLK